MKSNIRFNDLYHIIFNDAHTRYIFDIIFKKVNIKKRNFTLESYQTYLEDLKKYYFKLKESWIKNGLSFNDLIGDLVRVSEERLIQYTN